MNARMYQVQANRNGVELPTFFLSADVQGIVSNDHARRIAMDVIGDGLTDDDTYHVNSVMSPDGTVTTYTVDGHACAWVRS